MNALAYPLYHRFLSGKPLSLPQLAVFRASSTERLLTAGIWSLASVHNPDLQWQQKLQRSLNFLLISFLPDGTLLLLGTGASEERGYWRFGTSRSELILHENEWKEDIYAEITVVSKNKLSMNVWFDGNHSATEMLFVKR